MKLTVLGPGCWGLTIAKLLNNNFDEICVWGRESDITPMLKNEKRIEKPLEIQLDKKVEITSDLESAINSFLEEKKAEIIDIKYSVSASIYGEEQIYCFSALLLYK